MLIDCHVDYFTFVKLSRAIRYIPLLMHQTSILSAFSPFSQKQSLASRARAPLDAWGVQATCHANLSLLFQLPTTRPTVRPSVRPSLARLVKSRGFGVVRPFVLRGPLSLSLSLSLCRCMILSPFQSGSHAMSSSGDATVDGRPNWKCGFTPLFALVSSLALV